MVFLFKMTYGEDLVPSAKTVGIIVTLDFYTVFLPHYEVTYAGMSKNTAV
jgi:hypothetical protein